MRNIALQCATLIELRTILCCAILLIIARFDVLIAQRPNCATKRTKTVPKRLRDEELRSVLDVVRQSPNGARVREIVEALKNSVLDKIARKLGRKGGRKRRMTDSKIESARRLLANGVPPRDVALNLDVSIPTLYRWVPASAQA